MTITVREKEHWNNRITRKIDKAVESLLAAEDSDLIERTKREAEWQAVEVLGLADLKREVAEIEAKRWKLDQERSLAFRKMLAVIRACKVQEIDEYDSRYGEHADVGMAIRRRQELIEQELLASSDLGRRIIRLQQEKEELLDTVWLASSPKQIKELWIKVARVLGQEPTELQKEALSIEPVLDVDE